MPAPSITSFIEYNEINNGKRSSTEEFHDELKRFPRNGLLRLCAIVNDLTANWSRKHDAVAQAKLIRTLLIQSRSCRRVHDGSGQHPPTVRGNEYGCVRGVLHSRRNLEQGRLRDPRYLLVLRDVQFAS